MVRFFRTRFSLVSRKVNVIVLAFAVITGYALGSFLATGAAQSTLILMRTAILGRVSIVCLLPVILLPFLFTAFAVYIGRLWLFIPLAFFHTAAFGYLASIILCSFGTSGWLIFILFLFSDCISMPLLCWFWIRNLEGAGRNSFRNFVVLFVLLIGIAFLDHNFVSPFLVTLLS